VPEIIAAGVAALKIEGRYKDADYVSLTTSAYRKAVDEAWAGRVPEIAAPKNCVLSRFIRVGWVRTSSGGRIIRLSSMGARRGIVAF
jgi:collagenase-like PrtC family protease